jgi:hypothetical protein
MLRALLAASVVAVLLPAGAVAKTASCGDADSGFEHGISARGVTCTKARAVARQWHAKAAGVQRSPKRTLRFGAFTCAGRNGADVEHYRITCAHGTQTIRFVAGP